MNEELTQGGTNELDQSNAIPQDEGMNPDDAAAAMGFATTLSQQLLPQEEATGNDKVSETDNQLQGEEKPQEQPPVTSQPMENEEPTQDQPDTSEIEAKLDELEQSHQEEIKTLKHEFEKAKIKDETKNEYEGKLKEMEKKHEKEMKGVRDEIKMILNG